MTDVIALKRVYQPTSPDDGARVLVDRLWPRGKGRESLSLQDWYFDAAPSPALQRQLHQGEISAPVFAARYRGELRDAPDCLVPLMRLARGGRLTLLSAARDLETSYLPILRDALLQALAQEDAEDRELCSPPCFAAQRPEHD